MLNQEQLAELCAFAAGAPFVLCVSRNDDCTGYFVRDISDGPSLPEVRAELEANGHVFLGATAIHKAGAMSRLAEPAPECVLVAIAEACSQHLTNRMSVALDRAGLSSMAPALDCEVR